MKRNLIAFILCLTSLSFIGKAQDSILIRDLNPKHFSQNFTDYDQYTSIFCAQASEIAYWKEPKIAALFSKLRATYSDNIFEYKLIDDNYGLHHNQVLLIGTREFLIVAFRGTEPLVFKDWYSDAKYWNYENTPESNEALSHMPPGHGGFRTALSRLMLKKALINQIKSIISKCNADGKMEEFPIYLTGHSLGAAISQMFIEPLKQNRLNFSGAYHFAPPLAVGCVINREMKNKYGNIVYDIVNYKDYVPRAGRNDVAHFGKFYRICNDDLLYKETEAYVKFSGKEYLTEFKLHALSSHLKAIKNGRNKVEEINLRSIGDFPCMELKGKPITICN